MIWKKKDDVKTKKKLVQNEYPYEMKLVSFNTQYASISPYSDKTVLKTPDLVLKGNLYSKENRFLSEEYLLNYRTNNNNLGFRAGLSGFFGENAKITAVYREMEEDLEDAIYMPKAKNIKVPLSATIVSRRSVRNYEKYTLSLKDLSSLLYYAQGITGDAQLNDISFGNRELKLRATPSAGGLYPINLYMYLNDIEGLQNGFYLYYPYAHALKPINLDITNIDTHDFAEISTMKAENINVFFIFVYNMYINSRKYGDAGAAFAFIEAGEIAQNIQLVSTGLGLGSCDIGGYEKQKLEKLLNLDGVTNHVIHLNLVGKEGE